MPVYFGLCCAGFRDTPAPTRVGEDQVLLLRDSARESNFVPQPTSRGETVNEAKVNVHELIAWDLDDYAFRTSAQGFEEEAVCEKVRSCAVEATSTQSIRMRIASTQREDTGGSNPAGSCSAASRPARGIPWARLAAGHRRPAPPPRISTQTDLRSGAEDRHLCLSKMIGPN